MALANFFDKVHLGASQTLKVYDRTSFEKKLLSHCVAIYFTREITKQYEGRVMLDLLIRILARLYPNIKIILVDGDFDAPSVINLKSLAIAINPDINMADGQTETEIIHVGVTGIQRAVSSFFIGSNGWNALFSTAVPQPISVSQNPFGAAAAVCLACANLFRSIFHEELGEPALDDTLCFSTFHQQINPRDGAPELPSVTNIELTLVGTGAIGNATLWALQQLPALTGQLTLVDKEEVSLSNLQRYILMEQEHVGQSKVSVLTSILEKKAPLATTPISSSWQEAIGQLPQQQMRLIATALDTKTERMLLQSALPQKIVNAWTSPDCIGISRHLDFLNEVCLSCLYLPSEKEKSESEKIASSLGMPQEEPFIRQYLAINRVVDETFIMHVSQQTNLAPEKLRPYIGQSVRVLYSDGICGGRVISVPASGGTDQDMEVPLAHDSALAGILLAAEIMIETQQLRTSRIEPLTKINLMRPLHAYLREKEGKHFSGSCLCQDAAFQKRYQTKWNHLSTG